MIKIGAGGAEQVYEVPVSDEERAKIAAAVGRLESPLCPLDPQPILTAPVRWCRPELVISLIVGTNGKFVIDPLPVVNRIKLHPAPTCPAMLSRSFPGLSMK